MIRGKGKANGDMKGGAGRPSKYDQTIPERTYRLCLLGLTERELAVAFGIDIDTITEWKKRFPEFTEALSAGKQEADSFVAKALYHRAVGYSHPDNVFHVVNDELIRTEVIKYYPPDTGACRLWLKNRSRRNDFVWHDTYNTEISGPGGAPIQMQERVDLSALTDAELAICEKIGIKLTKGRYKESKSQDADSEE